MKRLLTIISLSLIISQGAFAQDDKIFHSTGAAVFTDYMITPATSYSFKEVFNSDTITKTVGDQYEGISYFTFIYNFRYNLSEPSENSALSFNVVPAIGLTYFASHGEGAGFMSINIPFLVGYEFGAGSTYNSTSNMGGFFRGGIEYTKGPLFASNDHSNLTNDGSTFDLNTSWTEPVITAGVRYWNSANKLREINLKYGFGASAPEVDSDNKSLHSATTIRLSWLLFLNY